MIALGPNYALSRIISTNIAAHAVQTSLDQFKSAFILAGWELLGTISGSGSTTGYELRSGTMLPQLARMRVKFYWDGSTTVLFGWPIIQIGVADSNGTNSFTANFLTIRSNLGNKTVRLIVNKYQFWIYLDATISPNSNYVTDSFNLNTAMGGVPFLYSQIPSQEAYWFLCGSFNQSDFRSDLVPSSGTKYAYLIHGVFNSGINSDVTILAPQLLTQRSSEMLGSVPMLSGNYPVITPVLLIGTTSDPIAVSLWDAIVVGARFTSKVATFADFHNWENITIGGDVGTLFVCTGSELSFLVPGYSY